MIRTSRRRSTWPGAEICSALSIRRAAKRQTIALVLLLSVAAVVGVAPMPRLRETALAVLILGAAALMVETGILHRQRQRLERGTDDLILEGFRPAGRSDYPSREVAKRVNQLCSASYRLKLARQWRGLLRLATRKGQSSQYPRAYISRVAVHENAAVIARIIVALEHGPGDAVAEVRLHRQWQQIPLPCGPADLRRQNRAQFARELSAIAQQLDAAKASTDSPQTHLHGAEVRAFGR